MHNPDEVLAERGWVVFYSVLPASLIDRLKHDLESAYSTCRATQLKNGVAENTDGSVHHLIGLGHSFLELLEAIPLWPNVETYFGGKFILNSMGGIINKPGGKTYASNVHRDVRTYYRDKPLMLNMLVMLDDFTQENGATHLLSGSHLFEEKPSDDVFLAQSEQAVGSAGSILLFNSNIWHAAGQNRTNALRRCITPTFSRPFMKQQCDYPRVLGYDHAHALSPMMRQILGYNSRVPASLEEWYQPPEKRMFQSDQH